MFERCTFVTLIFRAKSPGPFLVNFISVTQRGGATKGRKQMRANASKRRQTRTNASKRRGENAKQTQANASKRGQTQTKGLHPPLWRFFTPPFAIPLFYSFFVHFSLSCLIRLEALGRLQSLSVIFSQFQSILVSFNQIKQDNNVGFFTGKKVGQNNTKLARPSVVPWLTLRAQRLKKLEIALWDWNFQASHPPNPYFVWGVLKREFWRSGLNFSNEIEFFKRDWNSQSRWAILIFFNLWTLRGCFEKSKNSPTLREESLSDTFQIWTPSWHFKFSRFRAPITPVRDCKTQLRASSNTYEVFFCLRHGEIDAFSEVPNFKAKFCPKKLEGQRR